MSELEKSVGKDVGELVGESVGDSVGWSVGDSVGESVGDSVGKDVGELVGESVGDSEGWSVGDSVGLEDGLEERVIIGSAPEHAKPIATKSSQRDVRDDSSFAAILKFWFKSSTSTFNEVNVIANSISWTMFVCNFLLLPDCKSLLGVTS